MTRIHHPREAVEVQVVKAVTTVAAVWLLLSPLATPAGVFGASGAVLAAFVAGAVAAPGDEPSASTARLFLEQGLLGQDFVFAADGAPRPTSSAAEALEQVIRSRAHRGAQGADGRPST